MTKVNSPAQKPGPRRNPQFSGPCRAGDDPGECEDRAHDEGKNHPLDGGGDEDGHGLSLHGITVSWGTCLRLQFIHHLLIRMPAGNLSSIWEVNIADALEPATMSVTRPNRRVGTACRTIQRNTKPVVSPQPNSRNCTPGRVSTRSLVLNCPLGHDVNNGGHRLAQKACPRRDPRFGGLWRADDDPRECEDLRTR